MSDDPFAFGMALSRELHRLGEIRADKIAERRRAAQNRPITKARKSESMKRFYARKRAAEKEAEEEREYRVLAGPYEGCTCHLGNPPCSWCTDSYRCEACGVQTWDEECPKCGADLT